MKCDSTRVNEADVGSWPNSDFISFCILQKSMVILIPKLWIYHIPLQSYDKFQIAFLENLILKIPTYGLLKVKFC